VSERVSLDVSAMTGAAAPPRDNGELVFAAPWEGRVFALAVALVERLGVPWDAFRTRLIDAIADAPGRPYYESWAAALERLVVDHGVCSADAITAAVPRDRPVL
jgi:nitrile hydratase accessory protein